MRRSDTFARHARCEALQLWGIRDKISMCKHYGFEIVPNKQLRIEGEAYTLMFKRLFPEQDVPHRQEGED